MSASTNPIVFIIGGAVAGSTAAKAFAERGWKVVVFEQNTLPFGKIDDGLPRWHHRLQEQERRRIVESLSHPNIELLPKTKVGVDVSLERLEALKPDAIVLAVGAWRDRELKIDGLAGLHQQSFVYQNPLVRWFNHYDEANYQGPQYDVQDGAAIIGGGLASIDVAKLMNIVVTQRELRKRGIEIDVEELERVGINKTLAEHDLNADNIGLRGATIFYRRGKRDMQLASIENATPEQEIKLSNAREKIMNRVMKKYHVNLEEWSSPLAAISEGGKLVSIRFARNHVVDGKPVAKNEFEFETTQLISSIGSLPPLIPGLKMIGELYRYDDVQAGRVRDNIYALGNVLTGRGNVRDSRQSAEGIAGNIAVLLGVEEGQKVDNSFRTDTSVDHFVDNIAANAHLNDLGNNGAAIQEFINQRQSAINYPESLGKWLEFQEAHIDVGD